MSIEAMKLALDVLDLVTDLTSYDDEVYEAIDTLRTAIEQAEKQQFNPDWDVMAVMVEEQQRMAKRIEELEQAEKQEPVAYGTWDTMIGKDRMMMVRLDKGQDGCTVPLYAAPPQREWVGLTDEEIDAAVKSCNTTGTYKYFRAIEAKLKEKNYD